MKSLLFLIVFIVCLLAEGLGQSSVSVASNLSSVVSSNAYKNFSARYKNAEHATWTLNREGSSVRFDLDGINYIVRYNQKGRWRSTLKYIPVDLLDKSVLKHVELSFPAYSVFFAQHLRVPSGSAYIIKVEKGNEWKVLTLKDGEINVTGEYVRKSAD